MPVGFDQGALCAYAVQQQHKTTPAGAYVYVHVRVYVLIHLAVAHSVFLGMANSC